MQSLLTRLAVYNDELEDYDDLVRIVNNFMNEVNNELSQAIDHVPLNRFDKESEYLKPLPPLDLLVSYVSYEKEYTASKNL